MLHLVLVQVHCTDVIAVEADAVPVYKNYVVLSFIDSTHT